MGAIIYDQPKSDQPVEGVNLSWVTIERLGSVPRIKFLLTEGYYAKDEAGQPVENELGIPEWRAKGQSWGIGVGLNDPALAAAGIAIATTPQEDLGGATFAEAFAGAFAQLQHSPSAESFGQVLYLYDDWMNAVAQRLFEQKQADGTSINLPSYF